MHIEYNISKDYCSDWGAIEAIREMLQNAVDNGYYNTSIEDNKLFITSLDAKLDPSVFTVGISVKTGNAIGKYGEGFKLAMLVLTRLNLNPEIRFGDTVVTGTFKLNEATGVETFNLIKTQKPEHCLHNIAFSCDLTNVDIEVLKERLPVFSDNPLPQVSTVNVLYDRPGKIYVQGLYVCEDPKLTYGYNFAPDKISLNRDRNMVNGTESALAQYWSKTNNVDKLFHLIEMGAHDVTYLDIWLENPKIKAELARLFYNKYGDGAQIAKPGTSYYGGSSLVSTSSTGFNVYRHCGIDTSTKVVIDPKSPLGIMQAHFDKNKKHMRRAARVGFETLLNQAKGWKH